MTLARVLTAAAACVLVGAGAAACSGSFGSGPTGPVPLGSLGPNAMATSTATPSSSSVVLTYGENTGFQPLPNVAGYGGAIAFPKAAAPTPNPKTSGAPSTPEPVAIGGTLSVVKPEDGPDLNFVGGKGKRRRSRDLPARALAYVKLLPTHDVTLESYPRIALDVPRDIAVQYRSGEFGLALWNAGTKDSAYRLAVAERDVASTPPPAAHPSAAPSATPSPSPSPSPTGTGPLRPPPPTPFPKPTASPTLPPQRILFTGTATPLKLRANQPAIFALYALPHPSASAKPSASPSAGSTKAPSAATSASPASSASPSPSPKSS